MTLFNLELLTLGLLLMAAVLRSRPKEAAVLTRFDPTPDQPTVTVIPGHVRQTPDTVHHAYLERNGLREIRVSCAGQTIERRTFPAVPS